MQKLILLNPYIFAPFSYDVTRSSCVKQSRIWKTGSQTQTQKVTVFAIEPMQTVCNVVTCIWKEVTYFKLEIESKYNLFQLKKKERDNMEQLISFTKNSEYRIKREKTCL